MIRIVLPFPTPNTLGLGTRDLSQMGLTAYRFLRSPAVAWSMVPWLCLPESISDQSLFSWFLPRGSEDLPGNRALTWFCTLDAIQQILLQSRSRKEDLPRLDSSYTYSIHLLC